MPELPEVETVRRMLDESVRGRTIRSVTLSGHRLRERIPATLPRQLRGRTIERVERTAKYLLIGLDRDLTLLSHLGMSGRWLVLRPGERPALPHVHARIRFTDGTGLWFQDVRRFGLLRLVSGGTQRRLLHAEVRPPHSTAPARRESQAQCPRRSAMTRSRRRGRIAGSTPGP